MTQPASTPEPTPAPVVPEPTPPATPPADPPLGAAGERALAAERDARKALEKQFADMRTGLASALGLESGKKPADMDVVLAEMAKQRDELVAERTARMRAEVAAEKGLTAAQAARLHGTTKDELTADADALKALFPAGATPPTTPGATPEPQKPNGPAPDPSQGSKGTPAAPRPTSLTAAIRTALTPKP